MTLLAPRSSKRRHGTLSLLPLPVGIGLGVGGVCVTLAGLVGLFGDGESLSLARTSDLIVGLAAMALGVSLSRMQSGSSLSSAKSMAMFVASWTAMTSVAVLAFLLSGELESPVDAVFEAVSASTTTGFTTVADPSTLSHSFRLLRVIIPWATGLGVLVVAMGVLPTAIGGAELLPKRRLGRDLQLASTAPVAIRNILGMYLLLTVGLIVGYAIAGMGGFDALAYGLSTASTGGMANHADSLGHFGSAAIEWVAAIGMAAAGGNLVVVWWAFRGRFDSVLRSTELRLYAALTIGGFLIVFFGSNLGASDSAVAITSMLSTTGLRSANWAADASFVQASLLVATGIGAMSGSVGSGFRQARAARVALEVRRSLQKLLEPHRVGIIRIDGAPVKESSLTLTWGYLWMHVFTLGGLALVIYVPDLDLVGSLSLVVSIVSNTGVVVDGDQIGNFVSLSAWSEIVAGVGMLLGRLSIYPALITAAGFGRWVGRLRPHKSIGESF